MEKYLEDIELLCIFANKQFNENLYEADFELGARRHPHLRRKCVHIMYIE